MPTSSFTHKDGMPIKDPYQILGIPSTSTETDIKKAYRQLALKLHPDKQSGTLTDSQRDALDKQFHDVKDARSFLLDTEHAEAKKKYDANLASERVRHAEEAKREKTMSSRRKRMREELSMRERMAKTPAAASSSTDDGDRFDVDRLRREGERLREEYAQREAEVDVARKQRMAVERATQKLHKEDRQVRLKWSRKKVVGGVHTKQSLISIMKDFGDVEEVELLGSKGNSALITFANVSSCKPCVDAYRTSDTMRATFVGRRKIDDTLRGGQYEEENDEPSSKRSSKDSENIQERNLRQAAERERLMRQMELEEAGGSGGDHAVGDNKQPTIQKTDRWAEHNSSTFPPDFPATPEDERLSPFDLLEKYEKIILGKINQ